MGVAVGEGGETAIVEVELHDLHFGPSEGFGLVEMGVDADEWGVGVVGEDVGCGGFAGRPIITGHVAKGDGDGGLEGACGDAQPGSGVLQWEEACVRVIDHLAPGEGVEDFAGFGEDDF